MLKLSITVVAIFSGTASLAPADISYVFVDTTDTIQLNVNGTLVDTACGSNNNNNEGGSTGFCGTVLGQAAGFSPELNFNIYEPDGVTLSDTLYIFDFTKCGCGGVWLAGFASDSEGAPPLTPLSDATSLIETGGIQIVAVVPTLDNGNASVGFQSDLDAVPEPAFVALPAFVLMFGAVFYRRITFR